jgi:hypothetical protein
VPDDHVVVVHAERIVMSLPESLTRLDPLIDDSRDRLM